MSIVSSESEFDQIAAGGPMPPWQDCGYLDTGRVKIGARWRESQINAATPRTRSEVDYLGSHAERLQTALLYRPARIQVRDVLLAIVLGVAGAAWLFFGWSK